MTISSSSSKVSYAGNGTAMAFAVTFPFLKNSNIKAILRETSGVETVWTEGVHYTLTGAGVASGGTLTVKTTPTNYTPATGEILLIKRLLPEVQDVDLPLGGVLASTSIEEMVDRLTMMVQAHSEDIARAMLLPETSPTTGVMLPEPDADKVLGWDSSGTNIENKGTGGGDVIAPASSTDNAVVRYNGTSGQSIQDSGVLIDDTGNMNLQDAELTRAKIKDYALSKNSRGSISGAQSIDVSLGNFVEATITGNTTLSFSNWPAGYGQVDMLLTSDATAGHTLSFTGVTFTGPVPAAMAASKNTRIVVESPNGGTTIYGYLIAEGF